MNSEAAVLFERLHEHIAVVTLNRPLARNAVNGELASMLDEIVWAIEDDPTIWVAVLAAKGDQSFCAGADLKEVSQGRALSLATPRGGFAGFVHAARTKPWIAAPAAAAVGGGLELCLACDMVVAADTASFGLPEVRRGLLALAGGLTRLPRAIPRAIAMEMIATGRPIDAQRALQLGLINQLVPAAEVLDRAIALALDICECAPMAVRESLQLARVSDETSAADLQGLAKQAFARVAASEDFKIGPRAFMEKRKPAWTGR